MAFTYNSSNVGSSGLATVRFLIGDTSSGTYHMEDGEINAVLDNITSNHTYAAAYCAENISAYYSRQADTRNEGLDIMASQRAKAYTRLAQNLRWRVGALAGIFVGGRSQQTKDDRAEDTDYVQPAFTREMDDYPGTIASTT